LKNDKVLKVTSEQIDGDSISEDMVVFYFLNLLTLHLLKLWLEAGN